MAANCLGLCFRSRLLCGCRKFCKLRRTSCPTRTSYPAHLPYGFANFVWWSDEDLRALLKARVAGLGDEVGTTNAALGRVRDALTSILKEKGITAQVQSEEPSPSAFGPHDTELFGVPLPPPPTPTIIFSILTPKILIGRIEVNSNNDEVSQLVHAEVKDDEGRPYGKDSEAFWVIRIDEVLSQKGYLTSKPHFEHGPPKAAEGHYVVDLSLVVDAGPQFHIAAISADGGPLLRGRDFSSLFTSRVGDIAGPSPFRRLGPAIDAYYRHFGYADVQLGTEPVLDPGRALATYKLTVEPGPLYHLRSLTIQKLSAEQESKVRSLLEMKPGDVFQDDVINALYHKIADEPSLKGYSFSFGPKRDKAAGAVDLTLDFYRESDDSHVTIR